jgi:hypothetical protein
MAEKVRQALRAYLDVALLGDGDEGDAWTMRALPSTKAIKHRRRLFTVNVSNMEVLVAHYDPQVPEETGGFMVVDGTQRAALRRAIGTRDLRPAPYATAVGALFVDFSDLDDLSRLLTKPVVCEAARDLNDRLRTHAQVPSLQRQWHVPEFTAWVRAR